MIYKVCSSGKESTHHQNYKFWKRCLNWAWKYKRIQQVLVLEFSTYRSGMWDAASERHGGWTWGNQGCSATHSRMQQRGRNAPQLNALKQCTLVFWVVLRIGSPPLFFVWAELIMWSVTFCKPFSPESEAQFAHLVLQFWMHGRPFWSRCPSFSRVATVALRQLPTEYLI